MKVTGKNLLQGIRKIISPSEAIEGGVRIVNTTGGDSRLVFFTAKLKKGVQYTISYKEKLVQGANIMVSVYLPDITQYVSKVFIPRQDTDTIGIYLNQKQIGTVEVTDIQLELGTTATAYSPYREQLLTLPTPNGLPGIPVKSGGNYTDENGKKWACDEVDLERGVKVQKIGKGRVNTNDGTENEQYRLALDVPGNEGKDGAFPCIISVTPYTSWTSCVAGSALYLKNITKSEGSFYTAEELKALAIDVDFVYQLATPIETPLTPAEIAAYKSLTTYAPTTVLQATDGAGLEATYKCNVRKAEKTINDLYAELTAELEA